MDYSWRGTACEEEPVTVNTRALIENVLARYPGEWTTLRELIQNASDAQSTTVKVKWETLPPKAAQGQPLPITRAASDGAAGGSEQLKYTVTHHTMRCLRVENTGQPFTAMDWGRLKRIAEGNPDETKIGAFGVGFYSVFGDCEEPVVISGSEAMHFYWKGNSLFTQKHSLEPAQSLRGTRVILYYRDTKMAVPDLLSISRFLVTSLLTAAKLDQIELWVDEQQVLTLKKRSLAVVNTVRPTDLEAVGKGDFMEISAVQQADIQIDATAMGIVGWKPKAFESGEKDEDLTLMLTSSTRLRQNTASIATSPPQALANELERATKKNAPRSTSLMVLTSPQKEDPPGKVEDTTTPNNSSTQLNANIFSSALPLGRLGGRLFIGFPTRQTTGAGMHISAPAIIPTVEREAIDLNAHQIQAWNVEMLRVAGTMTMLSFIDAMLDLRNKLQGHSQSPEGTSTEVEVDPETDDEAEALRVLKTFTFIDSTPDKRVASTIEEAFWKAYERSTTKLVYSSRGVLPTTKVRIGREELSKFVDGIPVIPPSMRQESFVTKLRDRGFIKQISVEDVRNELETKPLGNRGPIQAFLVWAGGLAASRALTSLDKKSLLNAARVHIAAVGEGEGDGDAISLRDIKNYAHTDPPIPEGLPLPPTCLPSNFTASVHVLHLQALGWKPLKIIPWLEFLVAAPKDDENMTKSLKVAQLALGFLGQQWDKLEPTSKPAVVAVLKNVPSIPTKHGMRKPAESYFESVTLFKDLPVIEYGSANSDAVSPVLLDLGVRKTVELETIFTRLFAEGGQEQWSYMDLITYLSSVKDDIPPDDIKKLKEAALFPAEAAPSMPTNSSPVLLAISALFEPVKRLRELRLPVLHWQLSTPYSPDSAEGSFLLFLGLRRHPSVPELVGMMADRDPALRSSAMSYFIEYHQINKCPVLSKLDVSEAILPVQGNIALLVPPSECCTNMAAAVLGYNILRADLHQHAHKFGVPRDPLISSCVDRLISVRRPLDHGTAVVVFEYFTSRLGELRNNDIAKLRDAPIVPVILWKALEAQTNSIRHISPRACYLGTVSEYATVFDYVDFGAAANLFLDKCGAKRQPTTTDIAHLICDKPRHALEVLQSPERYLNLLLRPLARDTKILADRSIMRKLQSSQCLLGWTEKEPLPQARTETSDGLDQNKAPVKKYVFGTSEEIVVIDDWITYSIFKDSLLCAPDEDSLETLYRSLGSQNLSSLVDEDVIVGLHVQDQTPAEQLRDLILERSLFLFFDFRKERNAMRHDEEWLKKCLKVELVESATLHRSLRGGNEVQHRTENQAAAIAVRDGVCHLYIAGEDRRDRTYQISKTLCDLLLIRPNYQAYVYFEWLLRSKRSDLEHRYNIKRILRVKDPEPEIIPIVEEEEQPQNNSEEFSGTSGDQLESSSEKAPSGSAETKKRSYIFQYLLTANLKAVVLTVFAIGFCLVLWANNSRNLATPHGILSIPPTSPPMMVVGGHTRYLFVTDAVKKKHPAPIPEHSTSTNPKTATRNRSIELAMAVLVIFAVVLIAGDLIQYLKPKAKADSSGSKIEDNGIQNQAASFTEGGNSDPKDWESEGTSTVTSISTPRLKVKGASKLEEVQKLLQGVISPNLSSPKSPRTDDISTPDSELSTSEATLTQKLAEALINSDNTAQPAQNMRHGQVGSEWATSHESGPEIDIPRDSEEDVSLVMNKPNNQSPLNTRASDRLVSSALSAISAQLPSQDITADQDERLAKLFKEIQRSAVDIEVQINSQLEKLAINTNGGGSEAEYQAQNHWTSTLRSGSGILRYVAKDGDEYTCTFTITNNKGKLRDAILGSQHISPEALAECVTVHIEVCSTDGDLDSTFVLPIEQHEKLQKMRLKNKKKQNHVYVLARVYRVRDSLGIAMFADPWQLEQDGHITLEKVAGYTSTVTSSAPAILKEKFASDRKQDLGSIYDGDGTLGPNKIRLLTLDLTDDSAPLTGSLEVVDVNQLKRGGGFWAISYYWGPPPQGDNPSKFRTSKGEMAITESLASCLSCLRHQRVEAPIWADALCINQANETEKMMQVRRMGSLYAEAAQVVIWLGTNGCAVDQESPEVRFLTDIHSPFCSSTGRCQKTGQLETSPAKNRAASPAPDDAQWAAVNRFLKHPWFTRVWVVQELALGGANVFIMSGESKMGWDCFMESLFVQSRVFLPSLSGAMALHKTRKIHRAEKRKFELLELLEMFAYTESTWPRDKMFALLNLAGDRYLGEADFDPDYVSTDEAVMESYARGFVRHRPRLALELLYHAGHAKSASFCSWIPDFMGLRFLRPRNFRPLSTAERRLRTYPPTISMWKTRRGSGFFAGPSGQPGAQVKPSLKVDFTLDAWGAVSHAQHPPPVLAVRGYLIDQVRECHELGLQRPGARIAFARALGNMRDYISCLNGYPDTDDDGDDDSGELGAGMGWQDKLLLRLLVGDARGPHVDPDSDWAAHFKLDSEDNEIEDENQDNNRPWKTTAALLLSPSPPPRWPPETGAEVLSLDLSQDAHGYQDKPPDTQTRMMQYWQTAWTFANRIPGAVFCMTRGNGTTAAAKDSLTLPNIKDSSNTNNKRYAGIAPGAARPGDHIFVVNGGKVPLVLRKVTGKPYYRLIGECYIHGIMYRASDAVCAEKDVEICII
ncbi:hypothetical protein B0H63DRAFT_521799 [Podospora didyma]|uniref:Heterokaryon incompatibility domain-containing protein n=1 Tax=Podospora didyma TaxID=330526 RepID=A0AAE0NU54_9PEZI|nr:hypothetical protein B0H63DRAFT_521799 [Podospora didyma]